LNTIIMVQIPAAGKPPIHWDQGWYWISGLPPFNPAVNLSTLVTDATRQAPRDARTTAQAIAAAKAGIRASTWQEYGPGTLRELTGLYELR
jgi:hypothetical protein